MVPATAKQESIISDDRYKPSAFSMIAFIALGAFFIVRGIGDGAWLTILVGVVWTMFCVVGLIVVSTDKFGVLPSLTLEPKTEETKAATPPRDPD